MSGHFVSGVGSVPGRVSRFDGRGEQRGCGDESDETPLADSKS
jgi:hypothetical protein